MGRQRISLGAILWFLAAALLGGYGWWHRDLVLKIADEPQTLTAAALAADGPGANHHVRLTDYEVGEPVVAKTGEMRTLWYPVFVKGQAKPGARPPILYRSAGVFNQADLDAQRRRPPDLTGVVANGLPALAHEAPPEVLKALPGLDAAKVWYIDQMPVRGLVYALWGASGLCALFGLVCLVRRRAPRPAAEPAMAGAPGEAGAVRRYRSTNGELPPEVAALGTPDSVHRPGPWLRLARSQPALFVVGGLALAAASVWFVASVELPSGPLAVLYWLPLIVSLFVAVMPFLAGQLHTFYVFPDALVVASEAEYVVIPWEAVEQLNSPRLVVTSDGGMFMLEATAEDLGRLYAVVQVRLAARLLPPAFAALGRGEEVEVGPVRLSTEAIRYEGKTLPWARVGKMQIAANVGLATRTLQLWERGSWSPACQINLNAVPNDWLLVELVKRACPPHLLVADGAR